MDENQEEENEIEDNSKPIVKKLKEPIFVVS